MGNFPSNHVRIWNELGKIANDNTKIKMLETLLNGTEYVDSLKKAGLYAELMTWMASIKRGHWHPFPAYISPEPTVNTLTKQAPAKRAMDYLHEAYDLLGLSDNEPLSLQMLKNAYRKKAVSCHPDKPGGNAELFDSITKAYLYLEEVYKKLVPKGVRPDSEAEKVTMESAKQYRNDPNLPQFNENNSIAMVVRDDTKPVRSYAPPPPESDTAPIHINPKKLDMNLFNRLFEQNRLPDPEKDDGYGDWLKTQEPVKRGASSGLSSRGKFNIDVFNKTFENEARESDGGGGRTVTKYNNPDALILTPQAVVLGGEKPNEYTAAPGSKVQYTDLKAAYSTHTTFSQEIADTKVVKKSFSQAKAERENEPGPATAQETARITEMMRQNEMAERARQMRAAARDTDATMYHERIKSRMLIKPD
jgi:hypothetical protein